MNHPFHIFLILPQNQKFEKSHFKEKKRTKKSLLDYFFEKIKDNTYSRIGESHRQYIYSRKEIEDLLAGWDVKVFDGESYRDVKAKSKRLIFIATKR